LVFSKSIIYFFTWAITITSYLLNTMFIQLINFRLYLSWLLILCFIIFWKTGSFCLHYSSCPTHRDKYIKIKLHVECLPWHSLFFTQFIPLKIKPITSSYPAQNILLSFNRKLFLKSIPNYHNTDWKGNKEMIGDFLPVAAKIKALKPKGKCLKR
jgi:hypothetical protein